MFSLIFLLSLHCASFAQSERGKEPNIPASAGATKPSDAQQILKDEVKLEKSWIKEKKKERLAEILSESMKIGDTDF
jgi:hypothetical protein